MSNQCRFCKDTGKLLINDFAEVYNKPREYVDCPYCDVATGQVPEGGKPEAPSPWDNGLTAGENGCLLRHGDDDCECGYDKQDMKRRLSAPELQPAASTAGEAKVSNIHIGDVGTGIIVSFEDGTMQHFEMTEDCYKDRQQQTDSFVKAITAPPSPAGGELEAILTKLENAVAYDVALRQSRSRSGRSPKSTHAEALQAIEQLYNQRFEAALGPDDTRSRSKEAARAAWYTKESNHE